MATENINQENVEQTNGLVPAVPVPVQTNEEKLIALRAQLKTLSIKSNDLIINDGDINEITKLETERANINAQIKKLNTEIERDVKLRERETRLSTHLSIIETFENLVKQLVNDSTNTELNAQYESAKELLRNELTKSFDSKITIYAGAGVTGENVKQTLNPTAKNENGDTKAAQILELIGQGMTDDQIRDLGYKDGTVRYQRYMYNKAAKATQAFKDANIKK
jgi:hypothetical protein